MSTRSNIGIENKDGSIDAVYSHFDGYLEGVGALLLKAYQDRKKVSKLIKLGDISSLAEEIGTKHDFNDCPEGETNFYGRDRGEKENAEAARHASRKAYLKDNSSDGYVYLMTKDNEWLVSVDGSEFISLTTALDSDRIVV